MATIEPIILQFVLWKEEAHQPITPTEGLAFANSLIMGKPIQEEIKQYQIMLKKNSNRNFIKEILVIIYETS